jgi:hypothetical protein
MQQIVINTCAGGFGLSEKAMQRFQELCPTDLFDWEIPRNNPLLIQVVKEYGVSASGEYAELKVVEIPDEVKWYIQTEEYGQEHVAECHRTWG